MIVKNYGDLLAGVMGKKLISYTEFGSYQGDYIAALDSGENVELWKGGYGSCSGCDFLEAERDWNTGDIPDEVAKNYVKDEKPFAVIPKETMERVDLLTFETFLPANTRADIYEFDPKMLFDSIKQSLK